MIRVCECCGVEYESKRATKYCDNCRTFECRVCGKTVRPKGKSLEDAIERGYAFCSRECANIYNGLHRSPEARAKAAAIVRSPEVQERRKATYRARTGYDTPFENPEVVPRTHRRPLSEAERARARERYRRTSLERYGVEHHSQTPESREHMSKVMSDPEVLARREATNIERYGVPNPLQDPDILARCVAAAHTDEADRKRSETLKRVWAERHDEILAKRRATMERNARAEKSDDSS